MASKSDRERYIAENSEYSFDEDLFAFSLVDASTVDRLRRDGDIKLPPKKVNVPKDERWNTKQMTSKLMQGILNGDSIPKISESLLDVVHNNDVSATRAARTLVTQAENHGRLDSYKTLDSQGVVQEKVWIATPDSRTRASHLDVDGETVGINDTFSNGLEYPADPSGDPAEVYNCRCSMRTEIVGFRRADGSISRVDYERDDTMHEGQMDEERGRRGVEKQNIEPKNEIQEPKKETVESAKIKSVLNNDDYEEFMRFVNDSENDDLYRQYADSVGTLIETRNEGRFIKQSNTIKFSYENRDGVNRYTTLAHEYNHLFDDRIGKNENFSFSEIDLINEKCKLGSGAFKIIKETPSCSDEFLGALRKDMESLRSMGLRECYTEFRTSTSLKNATGGIQDALDGFYGTQKTFGGWGHGDKYYNRKYNDWIKSFGKEKEMKDALKSLGMDASNQTKVKQICRQYEAASEAWANVGSAVTCGGEELKAIEKYMPNTVETYRNMIGRLKNA